MKKWILLIFTIISLVILISYSFYNEKNKIFANRVIDKEKAESIISSREIYANDIELFYNDHVVPYAKKETSEESFYLLSQIDTLDYKGLIKNEEGFTIRVIKPEEKKEELIRNNKALAILLYNDKQYKIVHLKMTTLPVISISFKENKNKQTLGTMLFYEPNGDKRENILAIKDYDVRYHERGATSKVDPKKSYKVNILNKKGNKKKISMLGLREDNDWILNSLKMNDDSYMREKIGYDIWNALSPVYHLNMEFVEFIKDNEYMGIYYLQEPADMKTFGATSNDLLISVKKWRSRGRALYKDEEIDYEDLTGIDEMEFDKGLEGNDALKVKILRTFIPLFDDRYQFQSDINMSYDLDNSANYELFLNLIMATDNDFKNEKILFKQEQEKEYTIKRVPWDLDWSMNNERVEKRFEINEMIIDEILAPSILNSTEFKNLLKEKYFEIRNSFYNEKTLNELLYSYKEILQQSGSVKRDVHKWETEATGKMDFLKSCKIVEDFFKQRIEFLDNYYGGM